MKDPIAPTLTLCTGWKGVQEYLEGFLTTILARNPLAIRNILVLVPTSASKHVLELTLEHNLLKNRTATILPSISTTRVFLEEMVRGSFGNVTLIDPLLRQAILLKALKETEKAGFPPPFLIRNGLLYRILALYDHMYLTGNTLQTFTQRAFEEFNIQDDMGAERMAQQTRFLLESLTRYQAHLTSLKLDDASTLHQSLLKHDVSSPYSHIISLGPETLCHGDLTYLMAVPTVETVEIIVPESMENFSSLHPLISNRALTSAYKKTFTKPPMLFSPEENSEVVFTARDREEVLISITKLLKLLAHKETLPEIDRIAVVVPNPLPYLYLAKQVFEQAGIPYQIQDDFPLSTEPYLSAIDLIFDFIERTTEYLPAFQLLRNPFFDFHKINDNALLAMELELQQRKNIHGNEAWEQLRKTLQRQPIQLSIPDLESQSHSSSVLTVLETLHAIEEILTPLASPHTSVTQKISCIKDFLNQYERTPNSHEDSSRQNRAKGAFLTILHQLENVETVLGESPVDLNTFKKSLRLAIKTHTFSQRTGNKGIHIIDARSAALGIFDLVIIVGLNEGEWPAKKEHNIFYPEWLLREFGWSSNAESRYEERITFKELSQFSRCYVAAFRHQIEEDIPTVPSLFLDEIENMHTTNTTRILEHDMSAYVTSRNQALRFGLVQPDKIITNRSSPGILKYTLSNIEPVSATAFERYLHCPFKYYAKSILHLTEDEEEHIGLSPLQQGRIVHTILKDGFQQWDIATTFPQPVTEKNYATIIALFRKISKEKLPRKYHKIELTRLFGDYGHVGTIEWILRQETTRKPIAKRLLEYPFRTKLCLEHGPNGEAPWHVDIKGRVDRIDIDLKGGIHVFDYKTGKVPEAKVTLQVPLYAMCLTQDFSAKTTQATYLSLRDRKAVRRTDYEKTKTQLLKTYRHITEGHFPPRPYQNHLCNSCGYVGLCRKEITETTPVVEVQDISSTS